MSRRRGIWRAHRRQIASRLLSLFVIVAVALAGLIVEDWIPSKGHGRLVAFLIAIAAASLLVLVVTWLDKAGGTLYYVRLLFPSMSDWREQAAAEKRREMQDVRIIQRWIVAEPSDGGFDVADEVASIGAVLEAEMNRDSDSTGFHVAPNMLFPMAMALGYDMQVRDGFQFDELDSEEDKQRSWPFNPTSKAKAELAKNKPEFDHPMIRTVRSGGAGPVLVTVKLTPGPDLKPVNWATGAHVAVEALNRDGEAAPVKLGTGNKRHQTLQVDPIEAMHVVREAIRYAIHEHPGRPVLLNARMSKATALGVGWLLGNDAERREIIDGQSGKRRTQFHPGCGVEGCSRAGCLRPWSVLVPLLLDQESGGESYLAVRAHPAQPPIDEILRCLRAGAGGES